MHNQPQTACAGDLGLFCMFGCTIESVTWSDLALVEIRTTTTTSSA